MIYYTLLEPTAFISDPVNYLLFAAARFGANGDFYPAPEVACGGPGGEDAEYARTVWDEDLSDGLDSGQIIVSLDADLAGGTASWDVGAEGAEPLNYGFAGGDTVGSVRIAAGTRVPGEVTWSNLTITFYDDDVARDAVTVTNGPHVDTTGSADGVGEQVLVVTPDSTLYDRVSVMGTFRMTAGADTCPGPSDLFGQILIVPSAA